MNTIKIKGYEFEGPHDFANANFNEVSVIYAIVEQNKLIYVGITNNLKERMSGHHKEDCWRRNISSTSTLYVLIENSEITRQRIEKEIRNSFDTPCNEV